MPKDFSRSSRIAEQIQRELAALISYELKDPRIGLITLTGVDLSADYAHAKVFFTSMADAAALKEIEAGLRHASGFLRHELGRRIRIHTLPELHFVFDASVERGDRLSRLIDEAIRSDQKNQD